MEFAFGSRVVDRWLGRLLTPVLLFWFAGLLSWSADSGPSSTDLATRVLSVLPADPTARAITAAFGLVLVAVSAVLVEGLATPVLRLLAGEFPRAAHVPGLRDLRARLERNRRAADIELRRLHQLRESRKLHPREAAAMTALHRHIRETPVGEGSAALTRLGNIMHSGRQRVQAKYGLNPAVCWPHLWLLLDDPPRRELAEARAALDRGTRTSICAAASAIWAIQTWWALPLSAITAFAVYHLSMVPHARAYTDLIESTYDTYRHLLYMGTRLHLPDNPDDERVKGRQLTTYLEVGLSGPNPSFDPPGSSQRANAREN